MEIIRELLDGCFLIQPKVMEDQRGFFVKTYHDDIYTALGLEVKIREEFYSISYKNVVRGMHFQLPPNAHEKLVYCTHGSVRDVLLDLRCGTNYGHVATVEISDKNRQVIYIPKGVAHGFLALTDESCMVYKTSTVHDSNSDCGIAWNSFKFNWSVEQPIISARDQEHVPFNEFSSPF